MICARRAVGIVAFFAVFAAVLITSAPRASAEPEALLSLAGCAENTIDPQFEDRIVSTSLGFDVGLGDGEVDDDVTISENGAVSFRFGLFYDQIYFDLENLAQADNELIAPLWADVDLTQGGSITYGQDTYQGRSAFCVNWTDVVPRIDEKQLDPAIDIANLPTNTFQLVIIDRADRAAGDFDLMFNYSDIEWDDSAEPCDGFFIDEPSAVIAAEAPSEAAQVDECCNFEEEEICCPPEDIECCFEFELPNCFPQAVEAAAPVFVDGVPGLAGYSFPTIADPNVLELPGSGVIDGMIGPNGLAQKSTNSIVPGRHIFSIESGNFPQGSTLTGTVSDAETGAALEGSRVSFCTSDNRCVGSTTAADGTYAIPGVPDATDHTLWVSSPPAGNYRSQTLDIVVAGDTVVDVALVGPQPPVAGIGIAPSRNGNTGTPSVYYGAPFEITAEGCADGTATWTITGRNADRSGAMTYSDGLYRATVPTLRPNSGDADVAITITCPDGSEEPYNFPIYIDPAGVVLDDYSGELIEGATVTLYTAELEVGPYSMVADGDASIMDPAINVNNPSTTLDDGRFRWDTTTGWYYVEAAKDGCEVVVAAEEGDPASRSINVFVPPEVTDLELYLDCNNPPEVADDEQVVEGNTLGGYAGPLNELDVFDHDDNVVDVSTDAPAVLSLGNTEVVTTAVDEDGATGMGSLFVTVVDTTPPAITANDVETTVPAAPAAVTFDASAVDIVDGEVALTCDPAVGSSFAEGETSVTCSATDASGNTSDEVTFTVTVVIDDTPPACNGLAVEAETGDLSGTIGLVENDTAVGYESGLNDYTLDAANVAEYCVTTDDGLYSIDALVSAPAVDADSFWVSIDGGVPALWHIPNTDGFETSTVNAAGIPSAMPKLWDLDAGEHTVRFFARESGTLLDSFEMVLEGASPSGPPPECAGLTQEAENGALAGEMMVAAGGGSSGGFFVVAPAGSGRLYTFSPDNFVEFCVNVPADGEYRLDATTRAPDFRRDSFYVQVGDAAPFTWHIKQSGVFKTSTVNDATTAVADRPTTFQLTAGEQTIRFYQREEQTRLDRFELVAVTPG